MIDKKLAIMLYNNGHGYSEIGRQLNVSKQRIHQIIQNYKNYGKKRFRKKTRKMLEKQPCGVCHKPSVHLHHIDRNNANDDIKNLLPVCQKCHKEIHKGEKRITKNSKRIYEWSLKYKECINCFSDKKPHHSKGLCVNCNMRRIYYENKKAK